MTDKVHRPFTGILFCIFALLAFALQDTLIKTLSAKYPVLQILAIRTALVLLLLVLIGLAMQKHGHGQAGNILRSANPFPLLLRGVLAFFAFSSYYIALTLIPLADAAAVYMTAPLFVTALSVPFLGERVGLHRWAAVCFGFLAVVLMLQPGSSLFRIAAAIPIFSALCYAIIPILTRRIGLSQHPLTMTIYTTASYLLLCLLVSAIVTILPVDRNTGGLIYAIVQPWRMPAYEDVSLMALSGAVYSAGLLSITQAYRIAAVSVVTPFEYSYLVWASVLGFIVFGDVPGLRTVLGGIAVVTCGLYIIYRERRINRK